MSVYRWLHLTDLHLGMDSHAHLWPNMEELFLKDLERLHKNVGSWDLVIFTGDLTQSGTKAEFDALETFLKKLWSRFKEWGFEPLLLAIPGNHDLVRPETTSNPALLTLQHNWHLKKDVQEPFWVDPNCEQRQLVSKAFDGFTHWWQSTTIPKPSLCEGMLPGDWAATLEVDGFNIGVLGLNSAFLQLGKWNCKEKLHLDVRQFHAACNGDGPNWVKTHDACLLLTHHPVAWLSKEAQKHFADEIHAPPDRFGLHLFGHMHESELRSMSLGGSGERRSLQGSSLFGMETWGENQEQREHGYSLGELCLDGNELQLRIWPRHAIAKSGGGRKIERDLSFELEEHDGGTRPVVIAYPKKSTSPTLAAAPAQSSQSASAAAAAYDPRNPVFYVPFRQKGNEVIGREEALERLRQQLTAGRHTAIGQTAVFQGLGGLGKTQLAVEYAFRYRDAYPNGVIWLTADQDLDAQLVDLAVKARWIAPESEHHFKLEVARHRLRSISDCLIVFDNLENSATIRNYLPVPPAEPHLLVTSRTEQPDFINLPLDLLTPEQSLQLLIQEAGRQPDGETELEAARGIARTLAGLPLAIELAGAYLARRPVSFMDYLKLLQRNLKEALPNRLSSWTAHETDLFSTLQISEEVFDEEPQLQPVLDLLTWSAPAAMGLELISTLVGVQDKTELTGALGLGVALRILQQVPGSDRYAIHRLVREVRREQVPLAGRPEWVGKVCVCIGDWFYSLREDFSQLPRFEAEIDHLQAWHDHALLLAPQQAARLTWLQGYPSSHWGQYHETQRSLEQAFNEYKQQECDAPELLANLYCDTGSVLDKQGSSSQALELAEQAFNIRRELFGDRHRDTATSLNNMALIKSSLGDFKNALVLAEQALQIRSELFGDLHTDIAQSFTIVASIKSDLGNPGQALELAEQAFQIYRKLSGEQHPDTATSLNNMAIYERLLGDPKHALALAEQGFQIQRELLGERHPDTATSLGNMASYTNALGDPKNAMALAEQAFQIRLELFGERHPDTATSISNMALYKADPNQALKLAEKALQIRRELYGNRHPDTALSMHNVAAFLDSLHRPNEAFTLATEAHNIFRQLFGSKHPRTLSTVNLLSSIKRPGFRVPPRNKSGKGTRGKKRRK